MLVYLRKQLDSKPEYDSLILDPHRALQISHQPDENINFSWTL